MSVALLAEGVDRNFSGWSSGSTSLVSPSSRRAWIEISQVLEASNGPKVALLAEGVDRNRFLPRLMQKPWRRPPRGGRG